MKLFRKRAKKNAEEPEYQEPDMSSPFASFDAAWRAELETQSDREQESPQEGTKTISLRSIFTLRRVVWFIVLALLFVIFWAGSVGPLAPVIRSLLSDFPQRIIEERLFSVGAMRDPAQNLIHSARNEDIIFMNVPLEARANDLIRRQKNFRSVKTEDPAAAGRI